MNNNDADKIVEAIHQAASRITWWLFVIWIALFGIFLATVSIAKASPILVAPEPTYEIGTPPMPPQNLNMQYWYTSYVPGPDGVLPVEVFAPRLRAVMARETVETVETVEVPEANRGWVLVGFILLVLAIRAAWKEKL